VKHGGQRQFRYVVNVGALSYDELAQVFEGAHFGVPGYGFGEPDRELHARLFAPPRVAVDAVLGGLHRVLDQLRDGGEALGVGPAQVVPAAAVFDPGVHRLAHAAEADAEQVRGGGRVPDQEGAVGLELEALLGVGGGHRPPVPVAIRKAHDLVGRYSMVGRLRGGGLAGRRRLAALRPLAVALRDGRRWQVGQAGRARGLGYGDRTLRGGRLLREHAAFYLGVPPLQGETPAEAVAVGSTLRVLQNFPPVDARVYLGDARPVLQASLYLQEAIQPVFRFVFVALRMIHLDSPRTTDTQSTNSLSSTSPRIITHYYPRPSKNYYGEKELVTNSLSAIIYQDGNVKCQLCVKSRCLSVGATVDTTATVFFEKLTFAYRVRLEVNESRHF
jgi:hypothetical protein